MQAPATAPGPAPAAATPSGHAGMAAPSAWIDRFAGLVPQGGVVLDIACGSGRHVRFFRRRGHAVVAVDRDRSALAGLRDDNDIETIAADLEDGSPWPLVGRRFAGVIVTNYLWRPLLPAIVATVAPGGVLLYETFARGNEAFGKPSNPDFLLKPGELLDAVGGQLRVQAYEDLVVDQPKPAAIQRIAARRET
jgi:SAM-dependent methyltransferase